MDYLQYGDLKKKAVQEFVSVLNLIINGLLSISLPFTLSKFHPFSFKPYYKWITFNIAIHVSYMGYKSSQSFKPYYKWITFNIKHN